MIFVKAEEIKLPNTNNKYTVSRGRMVINPEYKRRQETLALLFKQSKTDLTGFQDSIYNISIEVWTYLDIDQCLKGVIDVLEEIGLISNDRNIFRLDVKKVPMKKNKRDRIYIIIR